MACYAEPEDALNENSAESLKKLKQAGVLLFLREGETVAGEFEQIMPFATFVKTRGVLLDL